MATLSPDGKRALGDFIDETAKSGKIAGIALGIANVDGEIYFHAGGKRIVGDPTSGDVTPDSVFWICSQTKMITSLAALKLIEQGKLSLDTPLGDHLPEFRNPVIVDNTGTFETNFRPATTVITVKHLLNFSSGLFYPLVADGSWALPEGYISKDMHTDPDPHQSFYRIVMGPLPGIPLKFEPGTDFVYGYSADALGFLIEKVSGQTLGKFCREQIFDPLGMESCSFLLTPNLQERLVALTHRNPDGTLVPWAGQVPITEQDPNKVRLHLGGVGLFSSPRDYLKLLHHILQINAGVALPNPIFTLETVKQLFVPALTEKGAQEISNMIMTPGTSWGTATAIATQDRPEKRKKGTIFWGGWAGTEHFIDPESGIAVVFSTAVTPVDMPTVAVWSKLETLVYAALEKR